MSQESGRQRKWILKTPDGRVKGPYSTRAILQGITDGKVTEEHEIARYPGGEWQPISKNIEFYDRLLETLSSESSKDESENDEGPVEPTRRGRVFIASDEDQFVMKGPQALPGDEPPWRQNQQDQIPDEPISRMEPEEPVRSEKTNHTDVIDLDDKDQIIKKKKKKKYRRPFLSIILVIAAVFVFLLWPTTPKGRVHLKKPVKSASKLKINDLKRAYQNAKKLFYNDDFESHWKAQNELVKLTAAHPKFTELHSLLCLVYRELWPFTFQDRRDVAVFSNFVRETRRLNPSGKDGVICEAAFALTQGDLKKAQNMIETALPHNVREAAFYEMRASIWGAERKFPSAIDYIRTLQNLQPRWVKPYRLHAEYLTRMNKISEAIQIYQYILKSHPNHAVSKIELGVLEQAFLGKDTLARQHILSGFKTARQLDPLVRVRGYKALGRIFMKEGNQKKALKYFELGYEHNPNDREIQRNLSKLGGKKILRKKSAKGSNLLALAEHYERQGDCFAAQAEYRAVFKANPKDARAAFKAANCLWKLNQTKEAIDWLDRAIRADPKYIEAYVKKAEFFSERYDFRSASLVLKRAVKLAPKNYLVYRGYAKMHLKRNDYSSAATYTERAVKLYHTDVDSLIALIRALLGKQEYQKAYEKSVQLKSLDPSNPEVQEVYIRSVAAIQSLSSAISAVTDLIESYPYTVEYRFLYGQLLKDEERYSAAEGILRQVLQIRDNYKPAMVELGLVLQAQGKFNAARDLFLKTAIQDPSDPQALFHLGRLYLRAGNFKAALQQFKRVLENNPLYPNAHFYAGKAALQAKKLRVALDEAKKEAKLNPYRADPHVLIGDIYFYLSDYSNCISSYQKAIGLREPSSDLYVKQARCYRLLGGLDNALQLLRTAELKEPGNPHVWKEMGAVCEMKENADCAIGAYKQYLTLAPNAGDRSVIEKRVERLLVR